MIMNQTFYNLVEINRYERDLASRQSGIRECFFLNRDPREVARKKKTIRIFPPLPCGMGMEWNERGDW